MFRLLSLTLLVAVMATPYGVFAQQQIPELPQTTVKSAQDFWALLCTLVLWLFAIVFVIGFIMLLMAGLNFMTGGGDEAKIGQARQLLTYGIVGIAVALLARTILFVVAGLMGIPTGGIATC